MKNFLIGRSTECDIVINDQYVSRRHCRLKILNSGRASVTDLNSKTGTFVNGRQIQGEHFLNPGDTLKIGKTIIPWQEYVAVRKTKRKAPSSFDLESTKIVPAAKNNKLPRKNLALIAGAVAGLLLVGGLAYYFFFRHPVYTFDKTYETNDYILPAGIVQTSDDGYVYCLTEALGGEDPKVFTSLIKLDKKGNKEWKNKINAGIFDDNNNKKFFLASKLKSADDGFIVVGEFYKKEDGISISQTMVVKTDKEGNTQWKKKITNNDRDIIAYDVQPTDDEGYILVGTKEKKQSKDLWIYKMDADGNKKWVKTYGRKEHRDEAYRIIQTNDDNFMILGFKYLDGRDREIWLVKIDPEGDMLWNKTYGGKDYETGSAIAATDDDGYIVVGDTYSNSKGVDDVLVIKIDSEGKKEWMKRFGGKKSDAASSVIPMKDAYIVVANTESESQGEADAWLIKINEDGMNKWERRFAGEEDDKFLFDESIKTSDGGFIIIGKKELDGEDQSELWVLKLDKEGKLRKK